MRCYAFGLCTNLSCGLALVTYRQIKRWHTVPPDLGGRQVLEPVGIWQADRCPHPSARTPGTDAVSPPARARSCRIFFPRHFFLARIFLPTAFFSALAKPAPIPIYFFLPGKKIALTKIVMVQGFEHQTPWFRRSFPYHYNTLMFVTDAKILLLSNNIRLERYITHHLHTYCMNLSQLKRLKSGHRFGATF